jgi:hypothetical protein
MIHRDTTFRWDIPEDRIYILKSNIYGRSMVMYNNDNDFELISATNIMEIPDDLYNKLLEEYDPHELQAYLDRDDELYGMDIETFVHLYRVDSYGLTDDEMDSGDND